MHFEQVAGRFGAHVHALVWMLTVAVSSTALGKAFSPVAAAGSTSGAAPVRIEVHANQVLRESLPDTFFGFNIRWSGFQNDLWDARSDRVKPKIIEALLPFKGAMYRYPGGLVANEYIWEQAVLPLSERKRLNALTAATYKPPLFGIREFFDFVGQVGGTPLYTLNLIGKGKPSDIEEYPSGQVAQSNRALAEYIRDLTPESAARYYQLGNELDRNTYQWSHEKYVQRSRDTIEAIQSVDSDARFIAFLREFNWRYRDGKKGISRSSDFIRDVLKGLPTVNDFSLHFYYDGTMREGGRFKDIQVVVDRVKEALSVAAGVRRNKTLGVWITEHSRRLRVTRDNEDMAKIYTSNLQAALSTADFFTAVAQLPEVKGTSLQALNGVGRQVFDASVRFGNLEPRPVYWAMRILNYGRQGSVLATESHGPDSSGYPGGYDVRSVALSSGPDDLALWVVNRALTPVTAEVHYTPFKGRSAHMRHYYLAGPPSVDADEVSLDYELEDAPESTGIRFSDQGSVEVSLPPSSVSTFLIHVDGSLSD